MNLQGIDRSVEVVALDGEWEFYPNEFLLPNSETQFQNSSVRLLNVPGNWNTLFPDGNGYGTYRLKVHLPEHWKFPIAIKLFELGTAYRMFVDQKEVAKNGIIGKNKEESKPQALPLIAPISEHSSEIVIIVHVSNFHFREGGLWYPIQLGNISVLHKERETNIHLDMFLLGSILIMGVYHTFLYLIRRKDTSALWFGLFCFDIIFRLVSFNEKYFHSLYPEIPHVLSTRIEYLGYYFAVPLFAQFLYSIFPKLFPRRIVQIIWTICLFFILLVLTTGTEVFTHSAPYFHICTIFSASFYLYVIMKAVINREESAILLLFGTSILVAGTLNDILFSMEYIHTFYIVPQALLIFIFIQSVLLSMRFSRAFIENETLSINLFELSTNLERKVMERTLEYKLEKDKVEQVSKIKDKFISIISHDLRTPMIGVSNLLELLKTKNYVQSDEERERLTQMCYESVQNSLTMIKQLLNFSRIETGVLQLKYKKVSLKKYIYHVLNDSIAYAKSKDIKIDVFINEQLAIDIDPEIFSHVIKNLVSNSIKFTPKNGRIEIQSQEEGDSIQIEIRDNGIGLSSENLADLFNPEKVKSNLGTEGEVGHGMGLFICKFVVDAHKGDLQFFSEKGSGMTCRIVLPGRI
ncbi:MAG: ATP-binding protein [Leptospiraceae bacterium]|nr:ATP-binding protein [Leptospiraceae bacterium]MCP5513613.1 ATP-binding protein [Leptospiraceae bacterium]